MKMVLIVCSIHIFSECIQSMQQYLKSENNDRSDISMGSQTSQITSIAAAGKQEDVLIFEMPLFIKPVNWIYPL